MKTYDLQYLYVNGKLRSTLIFDVESNKPIFLITRIEIEKDIITFSHYKTNDKDLNTPISSIVITESGILRKTIHSINRNL